MARGFPVRRVCRRVASRRRCSRRGRRRRGSGGGGGGGARRRAFWSRNSNGGATIIVVVVVVVTGGFRKGRRQFSGGRLEVGEAERGQLGAVVVQTVHVEGDGRFHLHGETEGQELDRSSKNKEKINREPSTMGRKRGRRRPGEARQGTGREVKATRGARERRAEEGSPSYMMQRCRNPEAQKPRT
jgi:hypothetical protein